MKKKIVTAVICSMALSVSTAGFTAAGVLADSDVTVEAAAESSNAQQMPGGPGGQMPGGAPDGNAPSGQAPSGELPGGQMPSGEAPSGEQPDGQMPNGEAPSGELPSLPDDAQNGQAPDNSQAPGNDSSQAPGQMPSGQMPDGQMPSGGENDAQNGAVIVKVESIDGNTITVTVNGETKTYDLSGVSIKKENMPSGQMPGMPGNDNNSGGDAQNGQQPPELPSGSPSSDEQIPQGAPNGQAPDGAQGQSEDATVSDISAGDMIRISVDENGNVTSVTIRGAMDQSQDAPNSQAPSGQAPDGAPNGQAPNGQTPDSAPNGQAPAAPEQQNTNQA